MKEMLQKVLEDKKTVAIGGHIRPDGDCIGSCLGLYQYIKANYSQIQVDLYLEEIPEVFRFLKCSDEAQQKIDENQVYDLFICLDCGDKERLGFSLPLFLNAKDTFCVDHHISNTKFANHNYVMPEASSTSELICNLIDRDSITKEMAEPLYIGIAHDTGVFLYSCTAPSTMEIAGELLRTGIDANAMIDRTYYVKTYNQTQILGRALLESILLLDKKCIASVINRSVMKFYQVEPSDMEGIVSQLRNTAGVEVAIFMYEIEAQQYKVSMRSNGIVDVSKVAQYFGGGGHKRAAGANMSGSSHDVLNNLVGQIDRQLNTVEE